MESIVIVATMQIKSFSYLKLILKVEKVSLYLCFKINILFEKIQKHIFNNLFKWIKLNSRQNICLLVIDVEFVRENKSILMK